MNDVMGEGVMVLGIDNGERSWVRREERGRKEGLVL